MISRNGGCDSFRLGGWCRGGYIFYRLLVCLPNKIVNFFGFGEGDELGGRAVNRGIWSDVCAKIYPYGVLEVSDTFRGAGSAGHGWCVRWGVEWASGKGV